MRRYLINKWQGYSSIGTACVLGTDDKEIWEKKVEEIRKTERILTHRFVNNSAVTVFAYATSTEGFGAMEANHPFGAYK